MKNGSIYLVLIAALLSAGCGSRIWSDTKDTANNTYDYVFDTAPTARSYHDIEEVPLIELNYRAASEIKSNINWNELDQQSPIYFKTFTNLGDPSDTAVFAKAMTDQVVAGLVQEKLKMTIGEPPKKDDTMEEAAPVTMMETILAADNATMAGSQTKNDGAMKEAEPIPSAMLTGDYVIADNFIYMQAQIVRLTDNAVISGHNWTLPITDNVRKLLPQLRIERGMEPTVRSSFN